MLLRLGQGDSTLTPALVLGPALGQTLQEQGQSTTMQERLKLNYQRGHYAHRAVQETRRGASAPVQIRHGKVQRGG